MPDHKRSTGNIYTKRDNHTLPTSQRRLVCADSKDYLKDPNVDNSGPANLFGFQNPSKVDSTRAKTKV
jgi:hypothetical protein